MDRSTVELACRAIVEYRIEMEMHRSENPVFRMEDPTTRRMLTEMRVPTGHGRITPAEAEQWKYHVWEFRVGWVRNPSLNPKKPWLLCIHLNDWPICEVYEGMYQSLRKLIPHPNPV